MRSAGLITVKLYISCAAPSSFFLLFPRSPPDHRDTIFVQTKTCGDGPSPSAEQNLIGSLVGKPARLTTGYTISPTGYTNSLSKHALQLIYIALFYIISADLRSTHIARAYCTPEACMVAHACALAVAPCLHYAILFLSTRSKVSFQFQLVRLVL